MLDQFPTFSVYTVSIWALLGVCAVNLAQASLIAPLSYAQGEQAPGLPLQHDHSKLSFRVSRTYSNSSETLPAFGWSVLIAIVAGASPPVVNGLAVGFLVFRLLFWAIYYGGIGKPSGGPRTMVFVGGFVCNVAIAIAAAWALAT